MPLPLPSLDDRTWTDLTAETTALIPRYAPNWTNWNASDPGITLVELFAWLTEMTIYRLDRISPRHRRKFLNLLGFDIGQPEAAATLLSFAPDPGVDSCELPAGVQFQAIVSGNLVPFRTARNLDVTPVVLRAIQVDRGDGILQDVTGQWNDQSPMAAFGLNPQPGAAMYLGFDELPSQVPLALGFRFQGPGNDLQERRRIIEEWCAQQEHCAPTALINSCAPTGASSENCTQGPTPPHHSAVLAWEVFTLAPSPWWKLQPSPWPARPYPGEVTDNTRSLTLDGVVEVNLPPAMAPAVLGQVSSPLYYIRCRLDAGTWDSPPELIEVAPNSVFAEQSVPVSQTLLIASEAIISGTPPTPGAQIGFDLQIDATETVRALNFYARGSNQRPEATVLQYQPAMEAAPGAMTLDLAFIGFGSGLPSQIVTLPSSPVERHSLQLFSLNNGNWQAWTLRPDLDASTRTDFHVVLDYMAGTLTFGNGERGQVVPPGTPIFCRYRTTQAGGGNLATSSTLELCANPWNSLLLAGLDSATLNSLRHLAVSHGAATGGAPAETLTHVTGRAVETLFAHERLLELCEQNNVSTLDRIPHSSVMALAAPFRGVNLIDLERLALNVPGTAVARARAWSNLDPDYPCLDASGVVTIAVLPNTPVAEPQPSAGLLKAIGAYLDRRRIVCTRLEITAPRYVVVSVRAAIQCLSNSNLQLVRDTILAALNKFLDPRAGGPEGLGWPFGRNVVRSEIMQVICAVTGVDYVTSLSLTADSDAPQCGNLTLCGMSLATPGTHEIQVS
jgi:hypothetical protein